MKNVMNKNGKRVMIVVIIVFIVIILFLKMKFFGIFTRIFT